jgi:hypothetical protein
LPLLKPNGLLAVHCNYYNIGVILDFCEAERMTYDVLVFYGSELTTNKWTNYYNSTIPFVLIYKDCVRNTKPANNLIKIDSSAPLDDITFKLLQHVNTGEVTVFIGDAICMALLAKKLCYYVIAFGNDQLSICNLKAEGVTEREVEWEIIEKI